MKKLVFLIALTLFVSGCSSTNNEEIKIEKPKVNEITAVEKYSLDCQTKDYTSIQIGGEIINETYIKVSKAKERETLYVSGDSAQFFGADYIVLDDSPSFLVIMRYYNISGLTEVVSIDKSTGIGFDVKTYTFGFSGAPTTYSYLVTCSEI